MWQIGTGKAKMDVFRTGIGMMGYGQDHNIVHAQESPLYSRALVFKDESGKKIVFVNIEACFVSISVKRGVVKRLMRQHKELQYFFDNVMITAQHTHSAPGGYSHYGFYNLSVPGFVPEVYEGMVSGIVKSILEAENNLKPAKAKLAFGHFDTQIEVAFNRSMKAFNSNPEVDPVAEHESNLAVDRQLCMLRIEDDIGMPFSALNWFGVHATSVSGNNHKIYSDNKGYAATEFEEEMRRQNLKDFVSVFAQAPCGDVTPNHIWDSKQNRMRGNFENEFESARYNGHLQYEKAIQVFEKAQLQNELSGNIDYALTYVDFSNVYAKPEFTNGRIDARTGPSCLGVAFFKGTLEGPGMPAPLAFASKLLTRGLKGYELMKAMFVHDDERNTILEKYTVQGRKDILVETGARKVLCTSDVKNLILPGWADKRMGTFKEHHRSGSLDKKPWTPQILPLQIVLLGSLAIVGVPGEITTVAGWRLRHTILEQLKDRGIETVIISPYANAYCGYITTYEEYQHQCYEGGHTVFGEWTLAAFQTKFKELAGQLVVDAADRKTDLTIEPVEFSSSELNKRSFADA